MGDKKGTTGKNAEKTLEKDGRGEGEVAAVVAALVPVP